MVATLLPPMLSTIPADPVSSDIPTPRNYTEIHICGFANIVLPFGHPLSSCNHSPEKHNRKNQLANCVLKKS